MAVRIEEYANATKGDLIFSIIQRDIETELTKTISLLLDQKLAPIGAEIKALDSKIDSLEAKISPLTNIYSFVLFFGGSFLAYFVMTIAKVDWASVAFKQ